MMSTILILSFVFIIAVGVTSLSTTYQKVQLTDVTVLTFQKGELTTGRRSTCMPQLQCVGGAARSESNLVETVQCQNTGFDGKDVNWECKTYLEPHLKLGKTQVSCEGYSYPDDPYVLVGSCGLEFTLEYTGNTAPLKSRPASVTHTVRQTKYVNGYPVQAVQPVTNNSLLSMFFFYVIFWSAVLMMCCLCMSLTKPQRRLKTIYTTTTPHTTDGSPAVVVVDNREPESSSTAFTNGVVVGSILTQRRNVEPIHTHTETIITSVPASSASEPSGRESDTDSTKGTKESTSFATTKRR